MTNTPQPGTGISRFVFVVFCFRLFFFCVVFLFCHVCVLQRDSDRVLTIGVHCVQPPTNNQLDQPTTHTTRRPASQPICLSERLAFGRASALIIMTSSLTHMTSSNNCPRARQVAETLHLQPASSSSHARHGRAAWHDTPRPHSSKHRQVHPRHQCVVLHRIHARRLVV